MNMTRTLVPLTTPPIGLVVALINGWGTVARAAAEESSLPFPRLAELAAGHGIVPGATLIGVGDEQLVRLADALYPVFAAPDERTRAARLNDVLAGAAPVPQVVATGGRIEAGWAVQDHADRFGAGCALAVRRHLADEGGDHRLGICSAARCADVFADQSAGGRRRFCSVPCQTRTRVAAFRARRRAT